MAAAIPGGNSLSVQTATGRAFLSNGEIAQLPTKGMQAWKRIPIEEKKPAKLERKPEDFARGLPPEGMIVCRAYIRAFDKNGRGDLRRNQRQSETYSGPQRDFLWITKAESRTLLPAVRSKDHRYAMPRGIAERMVRHYLADTSMGCGMSQQRWRPEDWRGGELSLVVEEATEAGLRLRLEGDIRLADHAEASEASRRGEFRLLGYLQYDSAKDALTRFDVIALGPFNDDRGIHLKDVTLGVAFELAEPDSLGYGTPPVMIRDGEPAQIVNYFGDDDVPGVREYFQRKP